MKKPNKSCSGLYFTLGVLACLLLGATFLLVKRFLHTGQGDYVKQTLIKKSSNLSGQFDSQLVKNIIVGSLFDLSGGAMELHRSLCRGAELCFNEANQAKELKNKQFIFKYHDYKYDRSLALRYTRDFFEQDKITFFLAPCGTVGVQVMADFLKNKDAAILFPRTGASVLRRADYTHVVLLSTSYVHEGQALVAYALKKLFAQKIAFFYQNDNFGKSLLKGALNELQKNEITEDRYLLVPYPTNATSLGNAGARIKAFSPDAIILFSVPAATMMLINQVDTAWFASKFLLGSSSLSSQHFLQTLKQRRIRVQLSHVVPSFMQHDLEIAQEFNKITQKYDVERDDYCFEGYIAARLFVDAIKAIGEPVTPTRIIDYFTTMKNVLWRGLKLNFDSQTRELSDYVWISELKE